MPDLGHNPNASFAERMRFRETFNVQEHLANAPKAPAQPVEINLTTEQLRGLALAAGFDLIPVEDPAAPKQAEDRQDRIAELELANTSLLQRLNVAEAEVRSYRSPKDPGEQVNEEAQAEVIEEMAEAPKAKTTNRAKAA